MLRGRWLFCVLAGLCVPTAANAQSVMLAEAPLADRFIRNELSMELDGKIHSKQDGKDVSFSHKAKAAHTFMERCLAVNSGIGVKAARYYTTAESSVTFDNNAAPKRSLRAERVFLVTQRVKEHIVTYSPAGPLTRDEMELTEHFDTMSVVGLLPGKSIQVGATWSVSNGVVLALCELDGVTEQSLQGKLESVKDDLAILTVAGKASGINLGAQVEMTIDARLEFDVKAQHIKHLTWTESDKRQQGPITPALTATVTIKLARTAIEEPEQLNKFALVKVPAGATPPTELTNIHHEDGKKRFEMKYPRDWHVTSPDDSPQLVLRHLERGEFTGQVTITSWKKIDPKEVISLEKFAAQMAKTPGWTEDKEIERKQLKETAKGHHLVYRVAASGDLDGSRTVQYFYLIVSTTGEQLLATFSVVPQHVERLGARDLEMIRDITFP